MLGCISFIRLCILYWRIISWTFHEGLWHLLCNPIQVYAKWKRGYINTPGSKYFQAPFIGEKEDFKQHFLRPLNSERFYSFYRPTSRQCYHGSKLALPDTNLFKALARRPTLRPPNSHISSWKRSETQKSRKFQPTRAWRWQTHLLNLQKCCISHCARSTPPGPVRHRRQPNSQ